MLVFSKDSSPVYPQVYATLGVRLQAADSLALVTLPSSSVALLDKDAPKRTWTSGPLWRKREVVRQERTVMYTTVDADGSTQVTHNVFNIQTQRHAYT